LSTPTRAKLAIIATCIQLPMLAVIFFGDFGFHFSRTMGSWNEWIGWIFVYAVVLVFGIATACVERRFRLAVFQFAAPVLLALGWWIYLTVPEPRYDASEHQFLVGKTLTEVEHTLGRRRLRGSGLDGWEGSIGPSGERIKLGTQYYNGMVLLYSEDKRVVEVRESP
jgi:hypothetical protein